MNVDLCALYTSSESHMLIVDATGLKDFGEGEWKVRTHGTDGKRRTWRKVPLLVDRKSGHVLNAETAEGSAGDAPTVRDMLPERLGRTAWKIKTGCSQRSFVECTNHRLKALTGDRLSARTPERQCV